MPRTYRKSADVAAAVMVALLDDEATVPMVADETGIGRQSVKRVVNMMEAEGTIEFVGTMEVIDAEGNVSRGRPQHVYKLTSNGRKRARRAAKAQVAA